MLDLSLEIDRLRPHLGDRTADDLIARERREVFSVYPEVRLAAWGGALLIAAGAGVFIKDNLDRIDHVAIAVVLGLAAVACYAIAWRGLSPDRRRSAGQDARREAGGTPAPREAGVVADYVLLLGALLLSADVGFIEQQFDVFGASGARHLLLLAIFHGFTAYRFDSKLVLSVSLASLAGWMGLDRNMSGEATELAIRAFACAAVVLVWRWLECGSSAAALFRARSAPPADAKAAELPRSNFSRVFEHFAATLALTGGVLLLDRHKLLAAIVTTAIAAVVIRWGFRTRVEAFVIYGFVYALIADAGFVLSITTNDRLVLLLAVLVAIPALVMIHRRFQRSEA